MPECAPTVDRVFIAGSDTLLGEALIRRAKHDPRNEVLDEHGAGVRLDDAPQLQQVFDDWQPQYVIHAAGPSGGIGYNQRCPAVLARDNLAVLLPILAAANRPHVRRLIYLASSCCYPRDCRQPMSVADLWTGKLEPTNQAYAAVKLAGIALCQAYRQQYGRDYVAAIPANAFGLADHFDPQQGHVVPALLTRMHTAKLAGAESLDIWGTGQARREFLHADEVADAALWVMRAPQCPEIINLSGGIELSIRELAQEIAEIVGYRGELIFDASRPDGMPRKALDAEPLRALGWQPHRSLRASLEQTYNHFVERWQAEEPVNVR